MRLGSRNSRHGDRRNRQKFFEASGGVEPAFGEGSIMFAAALFGVSDRVRQSPETHKPKNDASVRKKSAS